MLKLPIGRPVLELIKLCCQADVPIILIGPHGIGKSEILRAAAEEMRIDFISRDLSLMEPPDLIGLPQLDGRVTRYCPPAFLPTEGRGLLVFEELNRCQPYMRAPTLQLLTARTLNDYKLPPGWLPVAAINPPASDYETFDLDMALLSRFVQIQVRPDREEWLRWACANKIHTAVIEYVSADTEIFDVGQSNPRALRYVSDVLRARGDRELAHASVFAAIAGLVGEKRATAFRRFLRGGTRPLKAQDVLSSYACHRSNLKNWIRTGRLDLVRGSLLAVLKYLQPAHNFESVRSEGSRWKNLRTFFDDLPGDLRGEAENFFVKRKLPLPCKGGSHE